jgi:hypothetical protein
MRVRWLTFCEHTEVARFMASSALLSYDFKLSAWILPGGMSDRFHAMAENRYLSELGMEAWTFGQTSR